LLTVGWFIRTIPQVGTILMNTANVAAAWLNGTARMANTTLDNTAISLAVWQAMARGLMRHQVLNTNTTIADILQLTQDFGGVPSRSQRSLLQSSSSLQSAAKSAVSLNNIIQQSATGSAAQMFAGTSRGLRYSAETLATDVERLSAGEMDETAFETAHSEQALEAGVAAVVLPTSVSDFINELILESAPPSPPAVATQPLSPPPPPHKGQWVEDNVLYTALMCGGAALLLAAAGLACFSRSRRSKQAVLATLRADGAEYSDLERVPASADPYALPHEFNVAPEATPLPEMNKAKDAAHKKSSEAAERAEFEKILQEQQQYIAKRLGGV
jgi:hypothetical protein